VSADTLERSQEPPGEHLTMGIDPWEKNWMRVSILLLVVFAVAITVAGFAAGFQLPGEESEIDPRTVATEGPWADPGLRELGNGKYEAYVLAQAWTFAPRELVVPVGAEIDIYVTSADLQHGFKVTDTNINMQIVPGQVSKLSFTFDDIGEFPYICTEYCGQGHAAMFGTVKVVSEADFAAAAAGSDTSSDTSSDTTPVTTEAQG
jgi:cytochrome c oxidase subunit 2